MTLVNVGLKSLDGIKLPRLRTCNVENNAIADLKSVVAFVASCSLLESLNLQGNPCATKPRARERLAAAAPHRLLRTIDGSLVTPSEIIAGLDEFGDKRQVGIIFVHKYSNC